MQFPEPAFLDRPFISGRQFNGYLPSGYDQGPNANDIRIRSFSLSSTGSSRSRSSTASSILEGSPCASPPPPYHYEEIFGKRCSLRIGSANTAMNEARPRSKTMSARSVKFTLPEERRLPTGNLFKHRSASDFAIFTTLSCFQRNPYNIRVDDDGTYGNNPIRKLILENLSMLGISSMPCVVCSASLDVYDEFPLVNGTFFFSPKNYKVSNNYVAQPVRSATIRVQSKYLAVVCMHCMDDRNERVKCQSCSEVWNGSTLVIGSLYSYDVFAAQCCCLVRRACDRCHGLVPPPTCGSFSSFSDYSRSCQCPRCGYEDYHFVKPLAAIYSA